MFYRNLNEKYQSTFVKSCIMLTFFFGFACGHSKAVQSELPTKIQVILDNTQTLKFSRGERLPLYLWHAMGSYEFTASGAEELIKDLDKRGIGYVSIWDTKKREQSLKRSLAVAKAQQKLGLMVNINAISCLYPFYNGDLATAHIDKNGKPFFDESFGKSHKMGCPFTLASRKPIIKEQTEFFANAFQKTGVNVDFVFGDWEVDGPLEVNRAHEASLKCKRCRENIKDIENYEAFQAVVRKMRSQLQKDVYAEPLKAIYPDVLVGNYAVYPHDGYRYWYDYFEFYVDGQPCKQEQNAKYRKWAADFKDTGYTFAMPVVYSWNRIYDWYDYDITDYRWFYNMLLIASNAGQNTPADVPIISFVHLHTINIDHPEGSPGTTPAEKIKQFSGEKYQELLWHMLLRGTDTFYLWCDRKDAAKEVPLLHEVYSQSMEFNEFLLKGTPINFNIPKNPGTVISGLKLGNRVLIRRTDFVKSDKPIEMVVEGRKIEIKPSSGKCQIILLR